MEATRNALDSAGSPQVRAKRIRLDPTLETEKSEVAESSVTGILQNLPSNGNFLRKRQRVQNNLLERVVANYSTAPPTNQVIKTDPTNILVRALEMRNRKARQQSKKTTSSGSKTLATRKRITVRKVTSTPGRTCSNMDGKDSGDRTPSREGSSFPSICVQTDSEPRCRSPRLRSTRVTTPPPRSRPIVNYSETAQAE